MYICIYIYIHVTITMLHNFILERTHSNVSRLCHLNWRILAKQPPISKRVVEGSSQHVQRLNLVARVSIPKDHLWSWWFESGFQTDFSIFNVQLVPYFLCTWYIHSYENMAQAVISQLGGYPSHWESIRDHGWICKFDAGIILQIVCATYQPFWFMLVVWYPTFWAIQPYLLLSRFKRNPGKFSYLEGSPRHTGWETPQTPWSTKRIRQRSRVHSKLFRRMLHCLQQLACEEALGGNHIV